MWVNTPFNGRTGFVMVFYLIMGKGFDASAFTAQLIELRNQAAKMKANTARYERERSAFEDQLAYLTEEMAALKQNVDRLKSNRNAL